MWDFVFYHRVLNIGSRCFSILRGLVAGYFSEHQSFEEGVASEPICAVQAGGSDFAAGIKIFDTCSRRAVGFYAANHIMSAWSDWNQVFAGVYVETLAEFANQRESFCKALTGLPG